MVLILCLALLSLFVQKSFTCPLMGLLEVGLPARTRDMADAAVVGLAVEQNLTVVVVENVVAVALRAHFHHGMILNQVIQALIYL
jgi:hypothetical protein